MRMNSTGIITNTIQAPCVNFVTVTTMSTTAVIAGADRVDDEGAQIAPA